MEIWRFVKEHDNGITNFHFEISADLLNEEELALIHDMRPGLIQLEIGVQSTNEICLKKPWLLGYLGAARSGRGAAGGGRRGGSKIV